jgi:hypothetical protein
VLSIRFSNFKFFKFQEFIFATQQDFNDIIKKRKKKKKKRKKKFIFYIGKKLSFQIMNLKKIFINFMFKFKESVLNTSRSPF